MKRRPCLEEGGLYLLTRLKAAHRPPVDTRGWERAAPTHDGGEAPWPPTVLAHTAPGSVTRQATRPAKAAENVRER